MIPAKLKIGDEVRIIAPSGSLSRISDDVFEVIIKRFSELDLKVTFSDNAREMDEFTSSSIKSRLEDLHSAFQDKNVKAIICAIGGYNANQILDYINFEIIKKNPKIFIGYSDITVLCNAIYAQTDLVTYHGPNFADFGMELGFEYTLEYFKRCLMTEGEYAIKPSESWSDDAWYLNQNKREFIPNDGYVVVNKGSAKGRVLGGNLCTFNLLQGTKYMPNLIDTILFIEDDNLSSPETFDRDLQSLIQQPNFEKVKGIVLGRFQRTTKISIENLIKIIRSKKLDDIPIVANVDFGHTIPQVTFPIGGIVGLEINENGVAILISSH